MTLVSPTYFNVVALVKGRELYVFLYDDAHRAKMLRVLDRFAFDPELSFSRCNAELLSENIREGEEKRKKMQRQLLYKGRFHGEV